MKRLAWAITVAALLVAISLYWSDRKEPAPLAAESKPVSTANPATYSAPSTVSTPPPAVEPESAAPAASTVAEAPTAKPKTPYARLTIKAGQPIPELFPHQAERERLHQLAASQDPSHVPVIAASLRHPDRTVRDAACSALVQLGDPSAIAHLKSAEALAQDPEEKQLLKEAGEFLSLPKFMDVITATSGVSPNP